MASDNGLVHLRSPYPIPETVKLIESTWRREISQYLRGWITAAKRRGSD
jgi:hypothetical protein